MISLPIVPVGRRGHPGCSLTGSESGSLQVCPDPPLCSGLFLPSHTCPHTGQCPLTSLLPRPLPHPWHLPVPSHHHSANCQLLASPSPSPSQTPYPHSPPDIPTAPRVHWPSRTCCSMKLTWLSSHPSDPSSCGFQNENSTASSMFSPSMDSLGSLGVPTASHAWAPPPTPAASLTMSSLRFPHSWPPAVLQRCPGHSRHRAWGETAQST